MIKPSLPFYLLFREEPSFYWCTMGMKLPPPSQKMARSRSCFRTYSV